MPRKSNARGAQGGGTIRQRSDGRWEARITVGRDPGTGRQIQKSIYGATQREVRQKMVQAIAEVDNGTYKEPCKMLLGQWLDIWQKDYLGGVKPLTVQTYDKNVRIHIKPALGAIQLNKLDVHTVQGFINDLSRPHDGKPGLAPKTVKCIHGILHKALQTAVKVGYLRFNPADSSELPRSERKEIKPLDGEAIGAFIKAVQGHRFEFIYLTMLFTGLRRAEACGLTWDAVDLEKGTIRVDKQLQNIPGQRGKFNLVTTKNGKRRTITVAPFVVELLKKNKVRQTQERLKAGPLWCDDGFVFTTELGSHVSPSTLYHNYKRIVASIGLPNARLHDLRHSYAVASLRAGDDIKTVQGNLGHHAAAFTLDVYGHVTEEMKQASANRMEQYIKDVINL